MSHFTVVVTGHDVSEQLRPFDENNDNSTEPKWDWWQVGGRWSGYWKIKPGTPRNRYGLGEPGGAFTHRKSPLPGYADIASIADIDFEAMRAEVQREIEQTWDCVEKIWAKHGRPDFGFLTLDHSDSQWKQRKNEYWDQPAIKAMESAGVLGFMDTGEEFATTREDAIRTARASAACPFAVLHDGRWMEAGTMGWFGMSSDTAATRLAYHDQINALWDDLLARAPETRLTLVDCHI